MPLMEALHQDERELQLPQTVDTHTAPQLPGDKKLRTHKEMGGGGLHLQHSPPPRDCAVESYISEGQQTEEDNEKTK